MTASHSICRILRVLTLAAAHCLGGLAWSAEGQSVARSEHPTVRGVRSLDVYADGPRLHLLTGEVAAGRERPALFYRSSDDGGARWTPPVQVDAAMPPPFSLHRGMDAQLAAAGDHVVAVWMTAGTDKWGSGPMATALSDDGGKTWRAGANPADDGSTTGHGFLDGATGGPGVFHLTWLDSRDGKQGLRYARSVDHGQSWSANVTAKAATCECCSNTLVANADGDVAILFRDGNPRDMRLVRLADGGQRWLSPVAMGEFQWQFAGCPHVGGGLAQTGKGPTAVFHALTWTGIADRAGVYYVALGNDQPRPTDLRQLGDATATHPDLAADRQGRLAAVWDSHLGGMHGVWAATSADQGKTWSEPRRLSAKEAPATHPRVVAIGGGFRVFWTEEPVGQSTRWATVYLP